MLRKMVIINGTMELKGITGVTTMKLTEILMGLGILLI